jgi:hypothetical protein
VWGEELRGLAPEQRAVCTRGGDRLWPGVPGAQGDAGRWRAVALGQGCPPSRPTHPAAPSQGGHFLFRMEGTGVLPVAEVLTRVRAPPPPVGCWLPAC